MLTVLQDHWEALAKSLQLQAWLSKPGGKLQGKPWRAFFDGDRQKGRW